MANYKGLKPGAKRFLTFLLIAIIGGGVVWGINEFVLKAPKEIGESKTMSRFELADMNDEASLTTTDAVLPLPKFNKHTRKGKSIDWKIMAWNSQFPLMYAAGGTQTSEGSLFAQAGLDVKIIRQDDCFKTIADYIKNTEDLKKNSNAVPLFMSFMGDGMPGFSVMLKDIESKVGAEYAPIIFYTMGRSNGEDAFMGPASWKVDPKNCLGRTVVGVERDGDVNIVFKWAADNAIPVNTKTKYYDPNALNIIPCNEFTEAARMYISGYTEDRKLVRNGKTTDSIITVGVDAVTTWTPGDVMVAQQKGGLIRLASTKEYSSQMPNATVVCRKWAYENREAMENIIKCLAQAGDQVRSFQSAKEFAAKVSAEVYADKDKPASYWLKYYNGVTERDVQGNNVELGGSMAFNLKDAANMFGMGDDRIDRYKVTYETFGNILAEYYPEEMAGMIPYNKFVDKSFLNTVISNNPELLQGEAIKTNYTGHIADNNVVSNKVYNIDFEGGSSVIKSKSYKDLDEIASSAIIAEGLTLGIYGHASKDGYAQNQQLSEDRANAIAQYLNQKHHISFNQMDIRGYGDSNPVFEPATSVLNRCVEIKLGN